MDGEDIIEKFKGKVLREFLPCELLAANAEDQFIEYYDFDQCVDEFYSQAEKSELTAFVRECIFRLQI